MLAKAKLKFLSGRLKDGIPIPGDTPKKICGREVIQVTGKGLNCLCRTVVKMGLHGKQKGLEIKKGQCSGKAFGWALSKSTW